MKTQKQIELKLKEIESKIDKEHYDSYHDRKHLQAKRYTLKWVLEK